MGSIPLVQYSRTPISLKAFKLFFRDVLLTSKLRIDNTSLKRNEIQEKSFPPLTLSMANILIPNGKYNIYIHIYI